VGYAGCRTGRRGPRGRFGAPAGPGSAKTGRRGQKKPFHAACREWSRLTLSERHTRATFSSPRKLNRRNPIASLIHPIGAFACHLRRAYPGLTLILRGDRDAAVWHLAFIFQTVPAEPEEAGVAAACRAGPEFRSDAVEAVVEGWYRDHGDALCRLAERYETPSVSAEDIVQAALIRAWERIGDLEEADNARSWLSAFVRNWGLAVRNKHERRAHLLGEYVFSEPGALPPQPDELFDGRVRREERRTRLRALYAAIDELPGSQRRVLRSWARNRSLAAIARELGMPAATVRSHKARAIADLRKQLARVPEEAVRGPEVQRNRISRT